MEKTDYELACISALNRQYGLSPLRGLALLEKYGSASAVPGLNPSGEAAELEWLAARGHRLLSCLDDDYPHLLKEVPDRPIGLYYSGISSARDIFGYERAVAIVGTRDITPYGVQWCRKIVQALARCGNRPVIISGFAIGTDITAQKEALDCGLRTIGVLPCGPESIYPPRHQAIAGRLVETEGCALVSDYPPGTPVYAGNFIRRNRIIAGLADAVILIESKRKGGGLITMDFAVDYARATYALPGRAEDPCSEGCNILIRRNKAELISDTESLIESLGLEQVIRTGATDLLREAIARYGRGSVPERIFSCIKRNRGITADDICLDLNLPYSAVAEGLATLIGDGFVNCDLLQRYYISKI